MQGFTLTLQKALNYAATAKHACWPCDCCLDRSSSSLVLSSTYLVDEVLEVLVGEGLGGADDLVQVCVHEFIQQIDIIEPVPGSLHDVPHANDVLMSEVS
jgi:hypothetical protein